METEFKEIYRLFLSSVDDYELADVDEDELKDVLEGYLLNAMAQLQSSMVDVSDFDLENSKFNVNLSHLEKVALAKAMKLEWVGEKLYSADLMRKSIGDRDYKAVQGTDYLRQLGIMDLRLRKEIDRLLIDYSYTDKDQMGGLWS
ncbi:hypothetical protein [Enterococcus mundtii]|uniref:hypothetical protein n=1 Tax=Enterococcus mundtii TaxID=53346 RepID=UPI001A978DE4|nr:hypothetical protein [Enterococcus mundtii]MBO1087250.1 hypothetical protein [Enterococcus mundtii]